MELLNYYFGEKSCSTLDEISEFLIKKALEEKTVSELQKFTKYFNIKIEKSPGKDEKDTSEFINKICKELHDGTPIEAFCNLI